MYFRRYAIGIKWDVKVHILVSTSFYKLAILNKLAVDLESVEIEKPSGEKMKGFGVFYTFPRYGKQQVGWVPINHFKEVELMLDTYKNLDIFIDSFSMVDLTQTFRKVTILVSIYVH